MGYLQPHDRYWSRWMRAPGPLRRMAAAAAAGIGNRRPELALYADIPQRIADGREMFWGGAVAFWESQKDLLVRATTGTTEPPPTWLGDMLPASFVSGSSHEVVRHHLAALERMAPNADLLARMTYLEFKQRLPELLLMRVDKITMSTSVEARVPFLDPALVRYTMSLPRATKVPAGRRKDLLKAACRGLIPDAVIDREKRGFGAPMAEWLREDFGRQAEATILGSRLVTDGLLDAGRIRFLFERHRRGGDTSVPLWTLYNLTAWHARWLA
jgi:asparagine synthase (glutamine-hydrolysing)